MAYDNKISKPQGAIKLSEVFLDRFQEVIELEAGETALTVIEQIRKVATDALQRVNYVLHSDGVINWDGTTMRFDSDSRTNDAIFTIFQTPESMPRTIDLRMATSIVANTNALFKDITLADRELLYVELDRGVLENNTTGEIILQNACGDGGNSLVTGATVRKTTISAVDGMPHLVSPLTGASGTLSIPLALRWDWSDGVRDYADLWWIPHGIRWPQDVTSTLGAVIAKGLELYPTVYVHNIAEFETAVNVTTVATGGIIAIVEKITLEQVYTLPPNTTLLARSDSSNASNLGVITCLSAGGLILSDRCKMKDIHIIGNEFFGASTAEALVSVNGADVKIYDCKFASQNTTGDARFVQVNGNRAKIERCDFENSDVVAYKTGVYYFSGRDSTDVDCTGVSRTYQVTNDSTHSGGYKSSDVYKTIEAAPPIGSVIAIVQNYFSNSSNGGNVSAPVAISDSWYYCNGTIPNDSESPIWNNSSRRVPNLTGDRFLMGDTASGGSGGLNDKALVLNNIPSHRHLISHTHGFSVWTSYGYTFNSSVGAWQRNDDTNTTGGHSHGNPWVGTYGTGNPDGAADRTPAGSSVSYPVQSTVLPADGSHRHNYVHKHVAAGNTSSISTSYSGYTGSTPTTFDNRPNYLSCKYYIRIK